jgi:DNA mismatch repair protein MutL
MVSPPGVTRSSRGYIHLFVNRRAIAPRGQVALVIEDAYHTLLMKGRHPLAVLDIRVHPAFVDVNVHPTKSEVKFRDAPRVFGVLGRAVREALVSGGVRPWADAPAPPAPLETAQRRFELRQIGGRWERGPEDREAATAFVAPPTHGDPAPAGAWERESALFPPEPADYPAEDAPAPPSAPIATGPRLPSLRVVGQVAQTYIIAEAADGMYMLDQHAAHERVTYERLMAHRGAGEIDQQGLLMPQSVTLPPAAHALLLGNADALAEWGFIIEDFGGSVRVRSVPAGLREGDLSSALLEVAEHLAGRGGSTPEDWREAMLTTVACHSSVRAGQALSLEEMRELIGQLERCAAPRTCPHGRPTMILLSTSQLERQFGRIK